MNKRYQVFVSSTFRDLRDEREVVMKTLLELNFFPAGMEIFPAADDSQIKYIERIIDDSDYYILIVAGMYGSLNRDNISYTEMEFDYAVKTGKPILAFVHSDLNTLTGDKIERDEMKRLRLLNFHEKVKTDRIVKFWKDKYELGSKVSTALSHVVNSHPANGWIRAENIVTADIIPGSINDTLFVPARVFEPTETSSVEFNQDFTGELRRSRNYIFRGISGKRCIVRVKHLRNNPNDLNLKFIMPHPFRQNAALFDRISHRMRAKNEFDFDKELKKIQYEIPMSIVGLWNVRYHFRSCEIVFQTDSSISRLEVVDHAAYISLYDSNLTDRKYNPPIIKFSDDSLFYEVYRKEVNREIEITGQEKGNRLYLTRQSTIEQLKDEFKRLELGALNDELIEEYTEYYSNFEAKFLKQSKILEA